MKRILLFLLVAMLAACSMPETRMYSLSLPAAVDKQAAGTGAPVNVIVHATRYLSQSYIAYRVSPYQLDIASYSRWEAPPDQMVRDTLRDGLTASGMFKEVSASGAVAPEAYALDVNLKRFERSDEGADSYGELVMDARMLSPEGKEVYRASISRKVKLADRDFLGLAKALSAMLADGEQEMAAGISKALHAGNSGSM